MVSRVLVLLAALAAAAARPAAADDLANHAFQITHDASGITSLRRTADVADTDYIAAGGALGRLIVRYRTAARGDWKELRDLIAGGSAAPGEIAYVLAAPMPTLASRASGSAVQGVAGIRGLNDGIVPRPIAGGREAFIPELIDALEREGQPEWARELRRHWEGKVDRFVNRTPNLYGSEFAFDSTGFESTGAFAKYLRTNRIASVSQTAAKTFTDFQLSLNMADRGWLETTYYQMGSDYRGNLTYLLSYMSQMGGWAILDHALHAAPDPTEYLRLGYASSLSSWALVNSGTAESGYGYWYPGANNDGATGGGFMPESIGRAWIGKQVARGAWYYSAEEDVGYCAAIRTHATILARDPIFGDLAYGGVATRDGRTFKVIPRDGLRVRFHVLRDDQRLHLSLDHDGFAKEQPIVVADDLSRIEFTVENRTGGAHTTGLWVAGLPAGEYEVSVDGKRAARITGGAETNIPLSMSGAASAHVEIRRR